VEGEVTGKEVKRMNNEIQEAKERVRKISKME
jgi:hypothetical protein